MRFAAMPFLLVVACSSGSALAVERGYSVQDFDRIRVEGPYDVIVRVGPASTARATGPTEALDRLSVSTNDGTLVIRPDRNGWGGWPGGGRDQKVIVVLTTRTLRAVALAGSGTVAVDRMRAPAVELAISGSGDLGVAAIEAEAVGIALAGSGDVKAAGRAKSARIAVQGSGNVAATGLAVQDAQIAVSGSGDVGLTASRAAKVTSAGSGDVTVLGNPACTVSKVGSGDVVCGHGG